MRGTALLLIVLLSGRAGGQETARPATPAELRAAAWTVLALASDHGPDAKAPYEKYWGTAVRALCDAQDQRGRIGLDATPDWPATLALAVCALAEADDPDHPDAALRDAVAAGLAALTDHLRRVETVSDEVAAWSAIAAHTAAPIAPEPAAAVGEQAARLAPTGPGTTPRSECLRLWAGILTGHLDEDEQAARLAVLLDDAPVLFDDPETFVLTVLLCYRAGGTAWKRIQAPLAVQARRVVADFTPDLLASDVAPSKRTAACRTVVAVAAYYRYCNLGLVR